MSITITSKLIKLLSQLNIVSIDLKIKSYKSKLDTNPFLKSLDINNVNKLRLGVNFKGEDWRGNRRCNKDNILINAAILAHLQNAKAKL